VNIFDWERFREDYERKNASDGMIDFD